MAEMQTVDWPCRPAVASMQAELTVAKILIKKGDGFCRGRDLPERRQQQIRDVADRCGMTMYQALSLRRQILRSKPGGMYRVNTSNAMGSQAGQQNVANMFEECVADALCAKKIDFEKESDLRNEMRIGLRSRQPTPDFLFTPPVRIQTPAGIRTVGWLDCKNFYGCAMLADCTKIPIGKLRSKAESYSSSYGPGGFIFAQGYCADLQQRLPNCILLDAIPVVDMSRIEAYQNSEEVRSNRN